MAKNKSELPYLWTVMVYLAGDNNLTEESVFSIMEMEGVKSVEGIAVVAQFDPRAPHIPSHRHVIKNAPRSKPGRAPLRAIPKGLEAGPRAIQAPKVKFPDPGRKTKSGKQKDGETDTGNPATLFDFISWTTQNFRADRYMVILSGHGAGTEEDFLLKDEQATTSLSIPRLRAVFEAVQKELDIKIDILGMDVCLMSMVEVCYELNGLVEYLIASESFSPAAGWPYGPILEKLEDKKEASTETIASTMLAEYIGFYSDYVMGGLSVDQSVMKVGASEALADEVAKFASVLRGWLKDKSNQLFRNAIILAHWEAQSYNGELFVDLQDFCERLQAYYPEGSQACQGVIEKIKKVLVIESCFTGIENQFSNGVSIYFPWSDVAATYAQLKFATKAGWNEFLLEYVKRTRRDPRGFTENGTELLDFGPEALTTVATAASLNGRFRKVGERKVGERKVGERKVGERGTNPIRSMRNPPVTIYKEGLSECVRANSDFVERLEAFSKIRPAKQPKRAKKAKKSK